MNEEQNNFLLDEKLADRKMMGWLSGLIAVGVLAGSLSGSGADLDAEAWLIVIGVTTVIFGLGMGLAYLVFLRHMRIRMDEKRVWTHIPLQKDRSLEWKQIRTAAVVTLKNANYPAQIVLSVHEPQEALSRKRMVWKNPKRGEEMRIVFTDSRRAIIEQCLHMTLPELEL